jgi:hypothetical protein
MKYLRLDRIIGNRADTKTNYLQVKPELPTNLHQLPKRYPSSKKNPNTKKGVWKY